MPLGTRAPVTATNVPANNIVFDPEDPRDDELEALWQEGAITPWRVVERGGVRFGLFGLMGVGAAEVIGQADPVRFSDPLSTAERMIATLEAEGADVVVAVCLVA